MIISAMLGLSNDAAITTHETNPLERPLKTRPFPVVAGVIKEADQGAPRGRPDDKGSFGATTVR